MKRTILVALVLIAEAIMFSGCKKSDSSPSYQMTADISGRSAFNTTDCIFSRYYPIDSMYEIYAATLDKNGAAIEPSIDIYLDKYHGVGTYGPMSASANYTTDPNSAIVGLSCTVTITAASSTAVSGTFSFTESWNASTITVSNGSFTAQVK